MCGVCERPYPAFGKYLRFAGMGGLIDVFARPVVLNRGASINFQGGREPLRALKHGKFDQ